MNKAANVESKFHVMLFYKHVIWQDQKKQPFQLQYVFANYKTKQNKIKQNNL